MADEHFALVFGLNTFGALALFTVMQAIISSLGLDIQDRFWVYTAIFSGMTLVALGDSAFRLVQRYSGSGDYAAIPDEPTSSSAPVPPADHPSPVSTPL